MKIHSRGFNSRERFFAGLTTNGMQAPKAASRECFAGTNLQRSKRNREKLRQRCGRVPTKEELERMHFSKLDKLCRRVADNPYASSVEADQARGLHTEMLSDRFKESGDSPALGGKTVGQTQTESLRRRVADFLAATSALWDGGPRV